MRPIILVLLSSLPLRNAACTGGEGRQEWAGSVDTLPSSAIAVSNPATGMWDSTTAWRPVEELAIGSVEGSGPDMFASVTDIAVDAAGRIYVLDRQLQEIRVFDEDGTYVRTIGRRGGGPGEFEDAIAITFGPAGHLWVVNAGNGRYAVFDTAGVYRTAHDRRAASWSSYTASGFVMA